jgi:AcrR family transcriptional regulator
VATEPAAAEETPVEATRRGRPRSAGYDEAILDATLRLLGELGYARMSMDGIAAAAGVSKPTIYARYRGKADLATAALRHLRESGAPEATGDLRADLVAQLRQLRENVERLSLSSLVGTCLTEQVHNPELLELFRERTVIPRVQIVRDLMAAARDRGEIRPGADIEAAAVLFMGALQSQRLYRGDYPEGWEERIVDTVLRGMLR